MNRHVRWTSKQSTSKFSDPEQFPIYMHVRWTSKAQMRETLERPVQPVQILRTDSSGDPAKNSELAKFL